MNARDLIAPEALAVLDADVMTADDAWCAWHRADCPLVTARTLAVMEAVEGAMTYCKDGCDIGPDCRGGTYRACPLYDIRRAYEGKEKP